MKKKTKKRNKMCFYSFSGSHRAAQFLASLLKHNEMHDAWSENANNNKNVIV